MVTFVLVSARFDGRVACHHLEVSVDLQMCLHVLLSDTEAEAELRDGGAVGDEGVAG